MDTLESSLNKRNNQSIKNSIILAGFILNINFCTASFGQFQISPMKICEKAEVGAVIKKEITLRHEGKEEIQYFPLKSIDLVRQDDGQLIPALDNQSEADMSVKSCQSWIKIEPKYNKETLIQPEEYVKVGLEIAIPMDAKGTYGSGILLTLSPRLNSPQYEFIVPLLIDIDDSEADPINPVNVLWFDSNTVDPNGEPFFVFLDINSPYLLEQVDSNALSGMVVNSIRTNFKAALIGLAKPASAAGGKWSVTINPTYISEGISDVKVLINGQGLDFARFPKPGSSIRSRRKSSTGIVDGPTSTMPALDEILRRAKMTNVTIQILPNTTLGGRN